MDRYPTCSVMIRTSIMINGWTNLHVVATETMKCQPSRIHYIYTTTAYIHIHEVVLPHVRLFRSVVDHRFVLIVEQRNISSPFQRPYYKVSADFHMHCSISLFAASNIFFFSFKWFIAFCIFQKNECPLFYCLNSVATIFYPTKAHISLNVILNCNFWYDPRNFPSVNLMRFLP